ncbi:hypothetical protein AALO_G00228940 [Alosa alosa]|uniref:BEN domain-containing protein n=1 Tax=Alosa alosa TaxID=278164 RepID=A0AAV6FXX8_9TELE|nr:hypothetical protein AALO_G00228940 [Alosa alosa]
MGRAPGSMGRAPGSQTCCAHSRPPRPPVPRPWAAATAATDCCRGRITARPAAQTPSRPSPELLRGRHEGLDGGVGGGGLELLGGLEGGSGGRAGDVMKFELSDELEDELAPFLRELGPRGPTATPCGASPCQQAEMRMRGRPPGCGQLGDHCHVEQEEVFPGSGVFCDARALRRANQSSTPTAMVRNLLVGVFDKHTLLNSNLRGGSSKTSPYHNHHAPLDPEKLNAIYDPEKLNAIYDATLARFPSVRRAQIGISINSKLSEIRFYTRRASAERSRQ